LGGSNEDIPELLILLTTFKKMFRKETSLIETKRIKLDKEIPAKIITSS
jgi:hypothetical protein